MNTDNPEPFSALPADEEFFFLTPALKNYINTLINIAKSGTSIGLVKGDNGAGKTSLAQHLATQLQQQNNIRLLQINPQEGPELVTVLAEKIGISAEMLNHEPRKRVIEHLTRLRSNGITVVLIIDDAHLLSPQALHLVIRLGLSPSVGQKGLIHTLLFAESEIEERLWLSAVTDPLPLDRLYTLALPALSPEQTHDYLNHRLKAAGRDESAFFNKSEATLIQRKTEGTPGLINELVRHRGQRRVPSLNVSAVRLPKFRLLPSRTLLAAVAGCAVIAVAVLALWWRQPVGMPDSSSAKSFSRISLPEQPISQTDFPASQASLAAVPVALEEVSADTDNPDARNSVQIAQVQDDELLDSPLRNSQEVFSDPMLETALKTETEPAVVPARLPSRQSIAVAQPIDTTKTETTKVEPALKEEAPVRPSPGQRIDLASIRREKWLQQRQGSEYAIQILAGPNEIGLHQFIEAHRFPTTPGYYRARNGQYKLILPYPDQQQARQALSQLPENLQRHGKPWVRSMADIKQDMQ